MGRLAEAQQVFERGRIYAHGNSQMESFLGWVLALQGKHDEARAIVAELEARRTRGYISACSIALIYQGLGDMETAMGWYRAAFKDRAGECAVFEHMPHFAAAREDPRFRELMARVASDAAEARV
jgi:hypothetical protein